MMEPTWPIWEASRGPLTQALSGGGKSCARGPSSTPAVVARHQLRRTARRRPVAVPPSSHSSCLLSSGSRERRAPEADDPSQPQPAVPRGWRDHSARHEREEGQPERQPAGNAAHHGNGAAMCTLRRRGTKPASGSGAGEDSAVTPILAEAVWNMCCQYSKE